jgi:hypothetical protein
MIYYILLVLWVTSQDFSSEKKPAKRHLMHILSSETTILGKTNVNKFTCRATQGARPEHVKMYSEASENRIAFREFLITLNVDEFDCGMNVMTKDFKATIKGNEYPTIGLEIKSIEFKEGNSLKEGNTKADAAVKITLAGKSHEEYFREGQFIKSGNVYTIIGHQALNMTDFGLDPPSKFMGTVKVKDALEIDFEIKMERLEEGTSR